ncbi:MAG: transcriptional repressor [Bacillales bacterium]|nr:transcriptional repressor [Bacillales bacterium]
MNRRNTFQKELVLKVVRNNMGHITADEVYEQIVLEYPSIGKGTVYRNLNILVEEGKIKKIEIPDGPDRFDFTLRDHYHVKCTKCKKIYDVNMEEIPNLLTLVKNDIGFKFSSYDVLFKGICLECQNTPNNK